MRVRLAQVTEKVVYGLSEAAVYREFDYTYVVLAPLAIGGIEDLTDGEGEGDDWTALTPPWVVGC